ncbi:retrotransposon protein, putative, Ty1-copia subclass [Senna tora]|uniref:Retrotransposon protein, putative, Ty1-copia subclass n=1 Tax=Senna tora TaxID=362788 RepID=A0A834WHS5_9FABA|nr:retrotransposon protein, putative, Ty1-copia subclass [Senna tora]
MVRPMMSHTDLHTSFWGHSLETTAFILNRVPSKTVQKTPYEIWSWRCPGMYFMKIWGCEAYVKLQVSGKLATKSDKCYFVGYPTETKGYYFYIPFEDKVFAARTGIFLEKEFLLKKTSRTEVELEEICNPQSDTEPNLQLEQNPQVVVEDDIAQVTQGLRKSGRIRQESKRYGFLLTQHGDVMLMG